MHENHFAVNCQQKKQYKAVCSTHECDYHAQQTNKQTVLILSADTSRSNSVYIHTHVHTYVSTYVWGFFL